METVVAFNTEVNKNTKIATIFFLNEQFIHFNVCIEI